MLVGLGRVLAEEGMDVVGQEQTLERILDEAQRLQPDVVVLDLDTGSDRAVSAEVRRAAPRAKLIFWARDETLMEILDPCSSDMRVVALSAHAELRTELTTRRLTAMED